MGMTDTPKSENTEQMEAGTLAASLDRLAISSPDNGLPDLEKCLAQVTLTEAKDGSEVSDKDEPYEHEEDREEEQKSDDKEEESQLADQEQEKCKLTEKELKSVEKEKDLSEADDTPVPKEVPVAEKCAEYKDEEINSTKEGTKIQEEKDIVKEKKNDKIEKDKKEKQEEQSDDENPPDAGDAPIKPKKKGFRTRGIGENYSNGYGQANNMFPENNLYWNAQDAVADQNIPQYQALPYSPPYSPYYDTQSESGISTFNGFQSSWSPSSVQGCIGSPLTSVPSPSTMYPDSPQTIGVLEECAPNNLKEYEQLNELFEDVYVAIENVDRYDTRVPVEMLGEIKEDLWRLDPLPAGSRAPSYLESQPVVNFQQMMTQQQPVEESTLRTDPEIYQRILRSVAGLTNEELLRKDDDGDTMGMIAVCQDIKKPNYAEQLKALLSRHSQIDMCCNRAISRNSGQKMCTICNNVDSASFVSALTIRNNMGDSFLQAAVKMRHPVVVINFIIKCISQRQSDVNSIFDHNSQMFFQGYKSVYPILNSYV